MENPRQDLEAVLMTNGYHDEQYRDDIEEAYRTDASQDDFNMAHFMNDDDDESVVTFSQLFKPSINLSVASQGLSENDDESSVQISPLSSSFRNNKSQKPFMFDIEDDFSDDESKGKGLEDNDDDIGEEEEEIGVEVLNEKLAQFEETWKDILLRNTMNSSYRGVLQQQQQPIPALTATNTADSGSFLDSSSDEDQLLDDEYTTNKYMFFSLSPPPKSFDERDDGNYHHDDYDYNHCSTMKSYSSSYHLNHGKKTDVASDNRIRGQGGDGYANRVVYSSTATMKRTPNESKNCRQQNHKHISQQSNSGVLNVADFNGGVSNLLSKVFLNRFARKS